MFTFQNLVYIFKCSIKFAFLLQLSLRYHYSFLHIFSTFGSFSLLLSQLLLVFMYNCSSYLKVHFWDCKICSLFLLQLKSIVKPSNATKLQSKASGILLPKGITRCILLCRGDLLLFQMEFFSGNNYLKLQKGHLNFSQISVYRRSSTNVSFD